MECLNGKDLNKNLRSNVTGLTVGYGHLECDCHQALRTEVVSPGSFPALLLRRISSLMSTIFSL